MSINEEGYLSKDIIDIERKIYNQNHNYFDLAQSINKFGHSLKFKLNIHTKDAQQITSATLFVSLLESFNSLYILISKGLVNDSYIILRSILEKTLRLKYASLSYENTINYHKAQEKQRLKMMNVVLADKDGIFNDKIKKTFSKSDRDELKRKIDLENIKDLPSNEILAKITGLTEIYGNAYRVLNSYVHTSPIIIDKFLKSNQSGEITDLEWFSFFNDISPEIKMAMFSTQYLVLSGIESIMELFGIKDDEFEDLTKKLNYLAASFTQENQH